MIHPVLTILFDLFIIGSALAVASAMVIWYLQSRGPHIGHSAPGSRTAPPSGLTRQFAARRIWTGSPARERFRS